MLLGDNTGTGGAVPGSMQPGELRYAVVDVEVLSFSVICT